MRTATVERLDLSKPPPGYTVEYYDGWWWADSGEDGNETAYGEEGEAIAAAWAHHEARHDPPGMNLLGGFFCSPRTNPKFEEARAAAWRVYWDALNVADILDGENGPAETWPERCAWPRPLAWTREQRVEVRRWAADPAAELPEVLRAG